GIKNLDEHWDGGGKPLGLRGAAIPIYSRIALMAQVIDVFYVSNSREAALREVKNRSGTWFDPDLVAAFECVAARPAFWE
ncbi:HD domain-containing phosphohydrolase, partial [Acinetobacter baumannii]